jgi:hypothetical protein
MVIRYGDITDYMLFDAQVFNENRRQPFIGSFFQGRTEVMMIQ